jgi:DNA polymerase-3 subunit epsilon
MREICFDTETTGVNPNQGDRIVEVGFVELIDLVPTGKTFHRYVNPQRDMPLGAYNVHGLTAEFLSDKPLFSDPNVVDEMLAFIGDAPLIAHNSEFDRNFMNAELARINLPPIEKERCIDTLAIARKKFPGASATLDALCRRFKIDLSMREKHGALKDSYLLAEVYLELRGGRERRLFFHGSAEEDAQTQTGEQGILETKRATPTKIRPQMLAPLSTPNERQAHAAFVLGLGAAPVWRILLEGQKAS